MYTLADGRVMYVPPVVRSKLVELGIQPREPFNICKAERKEGNRRFIEWQVNKDTSSNDPPPPETPAPVNGKADGYAAPKSSNGQPAVSHLQHALVASIDAPSLPSSTRPRKAFQRVSGAKTCAPWRSACSSSTRAREDCDDRRRRRHHAGGAALNDRSGCTLKPTETPQILS